MYNNMSDTQQSTVTSSPTESRQGRVKWFNNRAGYGFVTDDNNTDYFVHHSAIKVSKEQYKYLVQGEYVNFSLVQSESDSFEFQVGEVSGVNGGQLMCETREEVRSQRRERGQQGGEGVDAGSTEEGARTQRRPRARRSGSGPRDGGREGLREGEEWMVVRRVSSNGGRGGRGSRGGRGGRGQRRQQQPQQSQQSRDE